MITIYTDGAYSSSSTVGGWAIVIPFDNSINICRNHEYNTTNNRMELTAVIEALKYLKSRPSNAVIYTDSAYIANCISQKWYITWANNGWRTSKKTPVLNKDLWNELLDLYHYVNLGAFVEIKKVSGHNGEYLNELADTYAVLARTEGADKYENKQTNENINIDSDTSRKCQLCI